MGREESSDSTQQAQYFSLVLTIIVFYSQLFIPFELYMYVEYYIIAPLDLVSS